MESEALRTSRAATCRFPKTPVPAWELKKSENLQQIVGVYFQLLSTSLRGTGKKNIVHETGLCREECIWMRGASIQSVREGGRKKERKRHREKVFPPRNPDLLPLGHKSKGITETGGELGCGIQHLPLFNS